MQLRSFTHARSVRPVRRIEQWTERCSDLEGSQGASECLEREAEVFQLLGHGLNSREISDRVNLGSTALDIDRDRIKAKLGIKNAAELDQHAAQWVAREIRVNGRKNRTT